MSVIKKLFSRFKKTDPSLPPMWTPAYTKLTAGSIISYMGNAITSFVLSFYVLEETDSVLMFALYNFLHYALKVFVPSLVGPYLDRFSRIKTIYTVDFISAGLYLLLWVSMRFHFFHFSFVFIATILIGAIDSIYAVATNSLYPSVVAPENLARSFSVQSILSTMSLVAVPIAMVIYNFFGERPIFLISVFFFLGAAIVETTIDFKEAHVVDKGTKGFSFYEYRRDFRSGLTLLWKEKALLCSVLFTFLFSLASGAEGTLWLPFFNRNFENSYLWYIVVSSASSAGSFMANLIMYRLHVPAKYCYLAVCILSLVAGLLNSFTLFVPVLIMVGMQYMVGLGNMSSCTLQDAAVQASLSEDKKARFCGMELMGTNAGALIGYLLAGVMEQFLPIPSIVCIFGMTSVIGFSLLYLVIFRKPTKELLTRPIGQKEDKVQEHEAV